MTHLLAGKRLLITGVLTESSIAFHTAALAQQQGAEIILTAFPRPTLTERIAKRLPNPAEVIELDVTNGEHLASLAETVRVKLGGLDGVVHSIGFAPPDALGGNFLNTPFRSVATALHVSAFSLKSLTMACLPLMDHGGSVVGLTFDARVAWPHYDWMGPAKAALEATNRYLARDLGRYNIRCNLIAAGPIASIAGKSIPGFADISHAWQTRAPLPWDVNDPKPVGCGVVALLSDWFPQTTGEIVHVDGGCTRSAREPECRERSGSNGSGKLLQVIPVSPPPPGGGRGVSGWVKRNPRAVPGRSAVDAVHPRWLRQTHHAVGTRRFRERFPTDS